MKDFKNRCVNSRALFATSLLTTAGLLTVNTASAQSQETTTVDLAVCEALSDSTSLDQESIENRIACYSRDVEQLNQLVEQLVAERNELVASADDTSTTIDNFQQELAQRQDAMQRLEERAAGLNSEIDQLTADRNQLREQLYSILSEGKDRSIEVEANERLFESFSQSYVSQSEEIEELKRRLKDFEDTNTALKEQQNADNELNEQLAANNEELSTNNQELSANNEELAASNEELSSNNEQLTANNEQLESQNQELQINITTLEQSVSDLNDQQTQLQSELDNANLQIDAMKNQLAANAELSQERLGQISELKTALADSEASQEKREVP